MVSGEPGEKPALAELVELGWGLRGAPLCCLGRSSRQTAFLSLLSPQFLESCDEVILLEDGEICEKGTHRELMEKRGCYAKLVHNLQGLQFKVTHGWGPGRGALPPGFWPGEGLSFPSEGTLLCLQDPEHIYNAAMGEALKEGPLDRDEGAGTAQV